MGKAGQQISILVADRLADFDWDGQIETVCREIHEIIEPHAEEISGAFWDQFVRSGAAGKIEKRYGSEKLADVVARGKSYLLAKYADPTSQNWVDLAIRHAGAARSSGVPLHNLLGALTRAHSRTSTIIFEATRDDPERFSAPRT